MIIKIIVTLKSAWFSSETLVWKDKELWFKLKSDLTNFTLLNSKLNAEMVSRSTHGGQGRSKQGLRLVGAIGYKNCVL